MSLEPGILALAYRIEGSYQVTQDVELVEEDGGLARRRVRSYQPEWTVPRAACGVITAIRQ